MRCTHPEAIKEGMICFNESRTDCCKIGIPDACPIKLKIERGKLNVDKT